MFHWTINLSDKQVLMLLAFFNAEDDKNGCRFSAVSDLIGNAWDIRSARRLEEDGLLTIERDNERRANRWNISAKGELIALAILEDSDSLQRVGLKSGREVSHVLGEESRKLYDQKRTEKASRVCTECKKVIGTHDKFRGVRGHGFRHLNCVNPKSYK